MHHLQMMSSEGFQYHFSIISKFICCDCYMKKNVAFTLISFAVLKWHECLSFQLPFELTVEIPVQLHLELEVNLLVHNVIEREIEREKVQMKPPTVWSEMWLLSFPHHSCQKRPSKSLVFDSWFERLFQHLWCGKHNNHISPSQYSLISLEAT